MGAATTTPTLIKHGKVPELITYPLKLKKAVKDDFLEVKRILGKKRIWGLIIGIPYWMINSRGYIENKNYRTTEATDLKDFGVYLKNGQIFITY